MPKMNDADRRNALARLPKWAQEEIRTLQRQIAEQARYIEQLSAGPADSDVLVHDYVRPNRLLGKGVRIAFLIGDPHPDGTRDRLEVEHSQAKPGWIDIRLHTWKSQAIYVAQTGASNVARVGPGPH